VFAQLQFATYCSATYCLITDNLLTADLFNVAYQNQLSKPSHCHEATLIYSLLMVLYKYVVMAD